MRPEQVAKVSALVEAVTEADGVLPLSEHVMLHMRYGGDEPARNVLLWAGADLVGYAHLDVSDQVEGSSAELAVHPEHRASGHGGALVEEVLADTPDGRLRLWAHGQHPAAAALARRRGFERTRVLWQMRRSLMAPLPQPQLPAGIEVRTFTVGQDEQAWTEVNNRAFASHPDQGSWGVEEVRTREREPWFDPAGFFLAERAGVLVGFHWTKVHGGHSHDGAEHGPGSHDHDPIGEVYVVGVDPSAQGLGLGPALTLVGLRYLRSLGLPQAMLYVDETNTSAIRVYERLGFTRWDTDVSFRKP
ncbi:MAG: mycothiol synthase [Actinomycetota bacterium]|nr:mycothiol synthase [Actinomycetota bacterium]